MKINVKDVMTTQVIWVGKDTPFRELAAALREHRVSAFPVLDEDKKVAGIVSRADVLAVFDRTDHRIRRDVMAGMARNGILAAHDTIKVAVKDGVVTLRARRLRCPGQLPDRLMSGECERAVACHHCPFGGASL